MRVGACRRIIEGEELGMGCGRGEGEQEPAEKVN